MTTCTIKHLPGAALLMIQGRIDGMSTPDIQRQMEEQIRGGHRLLAASLEQTSFISSVGLGVFLSVQKQLKKVGGELILLGVPEKLRTVFATSGFDRLFQFLATDQELIALAASRVNTSEVVSSERDGAIFRHQGLSGEPGELTLIGCQDKLAASGYSEEDVVALPQSLHRFGTGLATVGQDFEEYKQLFGEALILNHNFYFYPAVKRPAVDYLLFSSSGKEAECRFLHGFAFGGQYRYLASFEATSSFATMDGIVEWILTLPSSSRLFGLVMLAESEGVWGMNLKKVPILENKPSGGEDIFHSTQFASWINFPVEPSDSHHIVAGAGIVCRNRNECAEDVQKLFSRETKVHFHGGIFQKGPISKDAGHFEGELLRVLTELEPVKVQHLLGRSRFSNGLLGVIELKG